jgi:hypothetical protein
LNQQHAFPVRYYAKEAAPAGLKGDGQYTLKLLLLNGFLSHVLFDDTQNLALPLSKHVVWR